MQLVIYRHLVTTTHHTRRELNKARTREALLDALRSQLAQRGLSELNVEEIAEAADVSRRTFFNYFPSMEAALSEAISVPIAELATMLGERPADEPPLVAVRRVVEESPLPQQMLRWISNVRCSFTERQGFAVNVWAYHRELLEDILRERLGDGDELAVSSLASTIMAVFEAAERVWFTPDVEVDEAATARFNALLCRGLELAAAGWTDAPDARMGT